MAEPTQDVSAVVNEPLRLPRFLAAYQRKLPELEKLDKDELASVNLEIPSVLTSVLGSISEIRKLREPAAKALPGFDLKLFDEIEERALAMGYAHSRHAAASLPVLPVQELSDRVVKMRDMLATDCAALAKRGLVDGQRLSALKGPLGYKNQGFDLLVLVAMMREGWARIQGKSAVSAAELDEAETLADQLLTAVGEREQLPAASAATLEIRQRAYTLFIRAYDELRRVAEFLRWHEGDADEYVPSLYAGKKRRGSEVATEGQETSPTAVTPASAKAEQPKSHGNVPVGMPNSDPFTVS